MQPTPAGPVWVPCEFDVAPDGSVALVGGERGHEYPQLAREAGLANASPMCGGSDDHYFTKQKGYTDTMYDAYTGTTH